MRSGRDIPNNYRGVISEVAEAQAQDLGEFGERPVEEWGEALEWMQEISWDLVKQMVHVKTLRPSGRYAGTFQSKFRKCFNMAIKVYRSAIPGAKLLSKKMIFLLPRMLYFRVENKERINATLIKRADRYLAGDWEALFDEYVRESNQVRRGSAQSTYKAQKRKARELMEEGLVGKAVAMLAPSKVLDVTLEEVASQLKSQVVFNTGAEAEEYRLPLCPADLYTNPKYRYSTVSAEPEEGRGRDEDIANQSERVVQEDYVVQALRELPKHTTPSPDGWSYDQIRALDKEQARWLVGMVLDEEQEPEARWLLTTAKVLAFEKQAIGNAPPKARCCIVGSMLRMFVARVLRLSVRGTLVSKYEVFNQFGAGTSGGVEFAYQSVVEHHRFKVKQFEDKPDPDPTRLMNLQPVLLKYDIMNAFPTAYRDIAFANAMDLCPPLCPYFWMLYGQPSTIVVAQGGVVLHEWEMGRGAFQGDPLGGDFFVCAKAKFAEDLQRQFPKVWFSWILDDLTCSMTAEEVMEVDEYIKLRGGQCGLTVNDSKRGLTSLLEVFIPTFDIMHSGIPYQFTDSGVEGMVIGQGSIGGWGSLLGCPVGTDEYCMREVTQILKNKAQNLLRIRGLEHTQYETVALRLVGRITGYMERMLPPHVLKEALQAVNIVKREVLTGVLNHELTDREWAMAQHSGKGGGLDMGNPAVTALSAHLASIGSTVRTAMRLKEVHRAAGNEAMVRLLDDVQEAMGNKPRLVEMFGEMQSVAVRARIPNKILTLPPTDHLELIPPQQRLVQHAWALNAKQILRDYEWTWKEQVRWISQGSGEAWLWILAIPSLPFLRVPSEVFQQMVFSWLLVDLPGAGRVRKCRCGVTTGMQTGAHFISKCKKRNTWVGHRVVTGIMCKMYKQLGVPFIEEPLGLVEGRGRPADVMVVIPKEAQEGATGKIAWDVGITDPVSTDMERTGAWQVPLQAAKIMQGAKEQKFRVQCEINPPLTNFTYKPVIFETTSARGACAAEWWTGITKLAKSKESEFGLGFGSLMAYNGLAHTWSGQTFARHWGIRLSLTLLSKLHEEALRGISAAIAENGRMHHPH